MKKESSPRRPAHLPGSELAALQNWRILQLGTRELQAEGTGGIVRCDPETVAFRVGSGLFCVYGQELTIGTLQEGGLVVRGRILRTELIP